MRKTLLIALIAVASVGDYVTLRELTPEEKEAVEKAVPTVAPAKPKRPRKILIVNITKRNGKPSGGHQSIVPANYAMKLMGERTGAFTAVVDNDESAFRRENLKQYDAIVFNNTVGVLFDDPELRESLLDFVRDGRGFVGFHAAGATFVQYPVYDQFPEFGVMLGGYEDGGHPVGPKETTYVKIDDPKSPLTKMFTGPFEMRDEAFQFREPGPRERLHVLLSIDAEKTGMANRKILKQRREDMDFPISWIKGYGKGRVFYTTMGHNQEAFTTKVFLEHYLAGIQFAIGDLKADATPSAKVGK